MSDAIVVAERFFLDGTTGNNDYVVDRLQSRVPKAILVFSQKATVEGVRLADIEFSFGAADDTNEWCINGTSQDGVGTSHTKKEFNNLSVLSSRGSDDALNTALVLDVRFNAFIAGGVQLNTVVGSGETRGITIVFFFGDDLFVDVGDYEMTANPQSRTGLGFHPDALLLGGFFDRSVNDDENAMDLSIGFATEDVAGVIDQVSLGFREPDGVGTADFRAQVSELHGLQGNPLSGSIQFFDVDSFDDDGFTLSQVDDVDHRIGYFAIQGRPFGMRMKAFSFDSPTSAGTQAYTEPGFEPQLVLAVGTKIDTFDTVKGDSQADSFCVSTIDKTHSRTVANHSVDAVGTTDNANVTSERAIVVRQGDATLQLEADFESMDATGFTLDWTTVQGSARHCIGLAFELPQKPAGAHDLSNLQTDLANPLDQNFTDAIRTEKFLSLRLDPEGHNSSWIVFYSARYSYQAAGQASFEVRVDGVVDVTNLRESEDAANEFGNFSGFVLVENIDTPKDVALWINGEAGVDGRWGRLVAFRLDVEGSDFGTDETDGALSITGTTFQDLATVALTPATAGDYLIAGFFSGNAGANDSNHWRLEKDAAQFDPDAAEYRKEPADGANDRLGNFLWRVDVGVTAALHTYVLQASKELGGDANWNATSRKLVVLRLTGAYEFAYSEDLTGITKNNATFEDVETVTFTPSTASLQWLLMGMFRGEAGGTAGEIHMRMPDTDLGTATAQLEEAVDADDNHGFHLNDVVVLPASSQVINIQTAKTGGGAAITADNAKVLAIGEPALVVEDPVEFPRRMLVGGGGV